MFSSLNQLLTRTPENGTGREAYLSSLVDEYNNSSSHEVKCQVLANLSNFSYDPINYQYIRDVGVLDIFLDVIKNESNLELLHFAVAGVCNLAFDAVNAEYIITHCGYKPLIAHLKVNDSDILGNVIYSLIQLNEHQRTTELTDEEVVKTVTKIQMSSDKRLSNLATAFLLQDIWLQ